jgi:hypothetical protein
MRANAFARLFVVVVDGEASGALAFVADVLPSVHRHRLVRGTRRQSVAARRGPAVLLASMILIFGVMFFWLVRVLFTSWYGQAEQARPRFFARVNGAMD